MSSWPISSNPSTIVLNITLNKFLLMSIIQNIIPDDPAIGSAVVIISIIQSSPGKGKFFGDKKTSISLENRYDALLEDIEEGEVERHVEVEKLQDADAVTVIPDKVNTVIPFKSSLAKFKLAKELKSLGSLEPDHRKKMRDGKVNILGGDGSTLVV
ncbi:hypothetical protein MA16_Dca008864 [Dendrobium catenatum]|uniref:Uncharacterized protein n=1 Tax=Dendrobium catenatum TaxID=906689 RepID=A0A2I0VUJ1_9ASPA|nr:hypothetical protein MA16_Dca008864 [Dendrobium catenatum]